MRIWALVDEKPGNATQSIGVAQALADRVPGSSVEIKRLNLSVLSRLPNALLGRVTVGYDAKSRALLKHSYPDVAIAAGRRLVPALRALKAANPATRIIYLMHPQVMLSHFDLVAMPEHDLPPTLAHVIATTGAPHALDQAKVAAAAEAAEARFAHLTRPRIALLAGGDAQDCHFTQADWLHLGDMVAGLAERRGASILVTTSRRTGDAGARALMQALPADAYFHRWQPEGENPYHAMLGAADAYVVTGESMSMISEACALGKPVFLFSPHDGIGAKHARFHAALYASGHARPLTSQSELGWSPAEPLDEAGRVADAILAIKA